MAGSVTSGDHKRQPILVSVIVPCRNERSAIGDCIQSVYAAAGSLKVQVIVVDGLSEDGTGEALAVLSRRYPDLVVLDNPARSTPAAMNIGLRAAQGEVIIRVDAHCIMGKDYILTIVKELMASTDAGCVGGRTVPSTDGGPIQRAIGATLQSFFGVGGSRFRVSSSRLMDVDTVAFGAYRHEILDAIGGFDERLLRNQDIDLNYRLRRAGYRVILDPSVEIYYRPRASLSRFWAQNFGNGYWNIGTWHLAPGSLSWRHFVPLAFVASIDILLLISAFLPMCRYVLGLVLGIYFLCDFWESLRLARKLHFPVLAGLVAFPTLHVSYGAGSIVGVAHLFIGKRFR